MTDGLRDGWETSGCRDLVVPDKLMPLDLQQMSLAVGTSYGKPQGV